MRFAFLIFLILILSACSSSGNSENIRREPLKKVALDFVIGGHVYGNPDTYTESVYPPFYKLLKTYKTAVIPDYIILTGDVVAHPTEENWTTVKKEMDSLKIPWYIAPGNHDFGAYMLQNIQPDPYLSIYEDNNLMLILNTCYEGWSTDSVQTIFIERTIEEYPDAENLFVFSHQMWWLKNIPTEMELDSIRPNSYAIYDGNKDFWTTGFEPISKAEKPTYFFAGDIGCYFGLVGIYHDSYENYEFYGSGMGGAVEDNFLYVQVYEDGGVKITRIDF